MEFEFYEARIRECEAIIQYCSHMMITSATSSEYYADYKQVEICKAELEYWRKRAEEKGIYII